MRVIIIGCGYVGSALGQKLTAEGHSVVGVTRSIQSAAHLPGLGIEPRIGDCSTLAGAQSACRGGAEMAVFCVSSRGGDYQRTYVEGMRCVLHALESQPPRLFFHTSSTSVYAQTTGEWVAETFPTEPPHEKGKLLLQTEQLLAGAAHGRFAAHLLRLSGVYGPARHAFLDKLSGGAETLPGDGCFWMNQVHRDDIAQAILHLLQLRAPGPGPRIFNVSDDTPVLQRDYAAWCCRQLGRSPPVFKPDKVASGTRGREKFQPNRRISNQALRSLGWTPRYPSYREGLAEIVKREALPSSQP